MTQAASCTSRNFSLALGPAPAYACNCSAGYAGARCDTDVDDCGSSPCERGCVVRDSNSGHQMLLPPAD